METKLNFGCGSHILPNYINADILLLQEVDIVFDFNKQPYPFKDNSFEEVYADNVIEHLNDLPAVFKELHRICKPGAQIIIKVPFYHSKGASNDLTHTHFFNEDTFQPFYMKQHRSNYGISDFKLVSLELVPTRFGRLSPKFIRTKASHVLGEIYSEIDITLEVVK